MQARLAVDLAAAALYLVAIAWIFAQLSANAARAPPPPPPRIEVLRVVRVFTAH